MLQMPWELDSPFWEFVYSEATLQQSSLLEDRPVNILLFWT